MVDVSMVEKAKKLCLKMHEGQKRKLSGIPYATHPIEVAEILTKYGYSDEITQSIAFLHDVIEDTDITTEDLEKEFNFEISNGVFVLSRNTIDEKTYESSQLITKELSIEQLYKLRITFARKMIRRVKIADMIHNTRTLEALKPESQEKKITEAKEFYIPLGKKICPEMVKELENNINIFLEKSKNQHLN